MKYISTRGCATQLAFDEVLLAGLADDGGLYVPSHWPQFSFQELASMAEDPYAEVAYRIIRPFTHGTIEDDILKSIIIETYASFDHDLVAPLIKIGPNEWLLELFHGPTFAFKDFALQVIGRMFDHVLSVNEKRVTIVGATSGDTGSAAIEACRDRPTLDVFILFPEGKISGVQQRQMTTVASKNVHAVAIEGTFDDCQDLVKGMFNDKEFRDANSLSAVNSINWARVMVQIVYYFYAGLRLGAPQEKVSFSVPTGNFGNVLAGWAAWKCGLPVERIVVGTNSNDIMYRFFNTGQMKIEGVTSTLSPSMDIQVSSNFERFLFHVLGNDGAKVDNWVTRFRETGTASVPDLSLFTTQEKFCAARLNDNDTKRVIKDFFAATGEFLDPHSAIGVGAARQHRGDTSIPMVSLATAHPAKFPDAVEASTGVRPDPPDRLADLFLKEEKFVRLPNNIEAIKIFIQQTLKGQ